ncbi:MAG: hypothetical protein ACFFD4_13655 [Candidatus Odinarchaeota archaeon]
MKWYRSYNPFFNSLARVEDTPLHCSTDGGGLFQHHPACQCKVIRRSEKPPPLGGSSSLLLYSSLYISFPGYGGNPETFTSQGRRITRGLFRSAKSYVFNAGVNGVYNNVRKVTPGAFHPLLNAG